MKKAERLHVDKVAELPCCVGKRFGGCFGDSQIHHVAEGSGKRSWFSIARLCWMHHEGPNGIHGLGVKRFCSMYRLPNESEFGLLVWTNEDIALREALLK